MLGVHRVVLASFWPRGQSVDYLQMPCKRILHGLTQLSFVLRVLTSPPDICDPGFEA